MNAWLCVQELCSENGVSETVYYNCICPNISTEIEKMVKAIDGCFYINPENEEDAKREACKQIAKENGWEVSLDENGEMVIRPGV